MPTKRDWRTQLATKVAKREKAQAVADAAQEDLYDAMLAVFESGQGTYRQIAAATGLSRIRVGQVLRLRREARQQRQLDSVAS